MLSWSKHINYHHVRIKVLSLVTSFKRVSFPSSFGLTCKASITVEASLVLPIFFFYMMTILYTLEIVRLQSDTWEKLHQECTKTCFQAYENYFGEQEILLKEEENSIGKGNILLSTSYEVKPFTVLFPLGTLVIEDSCFGHGFVGYQGDALWEQEKEAEKYVYITLSGSKYHFSEKCTYLKVKIESTTHSNIGELRNASGEIYYACSVCNPEKEGLVYFTKWGNRYHGKSDCSALKRTVFVVPLSQVGARTACSKCA